MTFCERDVLGTNCEIFKKYTRSLLCTIFLDLYLILILSSNKNPVLHKYVVAKVAVFVPPFETTMDTQKPR